MDFYEAQDSARRRSLRLVLLFGAAVCSLVGVSVLLVLALLSWLAPDALSGPEQARLAAGVAGVVLCAIIGASLARRASLAGGGRVVAERLGGRLVPSATSDPAERRLLNVVEEMAIAAGVPVPPVYVLDDEAINAFAAGYAPEDAVIGITRGAVATLTRSELQGVVGHEFSHVLNGDMRLNIRLLALLFGIVFLAQIGQMLLRVRGRGRDGAALVGIGLGFVVIGFAGHFFGRLIQAAVSRQREYLADASAVQFTRDPDGIAGALKKIGGISRGSQLDDPGAGELSHMFFGSVREAFGALGATHPPLDDRIRAIDPGWDGRYPEVVLPPPEPSREARIARAVGVAPLAGASLRAEIGQVRAEHVEDARSLIDELPAALVDAAHDPGDARCLLLALLLPADAEAARDALGSLGPGFGPQQVDRTLALHAQRQDVVAGGRVTLVRLAAPALKSLSTPQYRGFVEEVLTLIRLDERVDTFEWVLHQVLLRELAPHFDGPRPRRSETDRLPARIDAARTVIACLAHRGRQAENPTRARPAREALRAGLAALGDTRGPEDMDPPSLSMLSDALRSLGTLHPLERPKLLKAAIACVEHDGVVDAREYELLVGIAANLDCPLPTGFGHLQQ